MKNFCLAAALVMAVACSEAPQPAESASTTLLDGKSLEGWKQVGEEGWKATGEYAEASEGSTYLMTDGSYKDFELRAEFWVDEPANSGIFVRCQDRTKVAADNCYEVNIYDTRPDPKYATGSIVEVASPAQEVKAAGKWNTYEIRAQGDHLEITLNGIKTVDVHDAKFAEGPIALQRTAGTVRFRSLQIRPL